MAESSIPQLKTCTKCLAEKQLDEFYTSKLGRFGRASRCKGCAALISSARNRLLRETQPERVRARQKAWRDANPERLAGLKRKDYERRRETVIAQAAAWAEQNADRRRESQQAWRDKNRTKVRQSQRQALAKKMATAKGRLERAVAANMRSRLRPGEKAGRKAFDLLPYSVAELAGHLEKQFHSGMSWENYGRSGWHVDHRIPLSAFNYETPEDIDFQKAWSLSNLQPLWAHDNHVKSCKLDGPFQPSLLLGERQNGRADVGLEGVGTSPFWAFESYRKEHA